MKAYRSVMDKYSRQASQYDRRWNRSFGDATLEAAIAAIPWTGLKRLLDLGCGTGLLEEAVRARLQKPLQVVGVDISLAMLQQARQKLRNGYCLHWTNVQAEHLPFAKESFDGVACINSFHYYRQPLRVLQEIHRVVRPDGWLVLTDWCNDFLACKVGHWALRVADRTRIHRYAMAHCYGMAECAELLHQAGFRIEMDHRLPIEWGWGVMVYRARRRH
ncbi:MAG: methyltransferase domain-containing protein [Acidobacteria bacterium]|nr:methyltransferase domain-containing protein [Acidobacteriota bacterium]